MWLINTVSLSLETIADPDACTYAVLSHTWGNSEISFHDMKDLDQVRTKPEFSKIEKTCQLARDRSIDYVWVDTCCIDKSSSAELTEAINSMFRWYRNSAVCFVYLMDLISHDKGSTIHELPHCRWFSRGWTLQELIAPRNVEFYDQNWNLRGNKISLQRQLSDITHIDIEVLLDSDALSIIPVAKRMSWAATRRTSRVEDLAYCLFGIFDINLPLIYGEGPKAFIRLQEAIAQDNNDLSLLAWTSLRCNSKYRGVFAATPSEFKRCGKIQNFLNPAIKRVPFSITNRGFHIKSTLYETQGPDYLFSLWCVDSGTQHSDGSNSIVFIRLVRTADGYVRYDSDQQLGCSISELEKMETQEDVPIYIRKVVSLIESKSLEWKLEHNFRFRVENTSTLSHHTTISPEHLCDHRMNTIMTNGYENFLGMIDIEIKGSKRDLRGFLKATSQPKEKSLTACPLIHHFSSYTGYFGFEPHHENHQRVESGNAQLVKSPEPWAAIFSADDLDTEEISSVTNIISSKAIPDPSMYLRQIIYSRGKPETLTFIPRWSIEGGSTESSDNSDDPDEFAHGQSVQLSFLTKRSEDKATGRYYDLVLKINSSK